MDCHEINELNSHNDEVRAIPQNPRKISDTINLRLDCHAKPKGLSRNDDIGTPFYNSVDSSLVFIKSTITSKMRFHARFCGIESINYLLPSLRVSVTSEAIHRIHKYLENRRIAKRFHESIKTNSKILYRLPQHFLKMLRNDEKGIDCHAKPKGLSRNDGKSTILRKNTNSRISQ